MLAHKIGPDRESSVRLLPKGTQLEEHNPSKSTVGRESIDFGAMGINLRGVQGGPGRPSRIYRTGDSTLITLRNAARLRLELGITSFLDLRSREETLKYGKPLGLIAGGVRWARAPLTGYGDVSINGRSQGVADYAAYYLGICEQASKRLSHIFGLIASLSGSPFLIGCHFGKDRTGIVVAILLAILGYSVDAIAKDYAASAKALARHADHFRDHWEKRGQTKTEYVLRLRPQEATIKTALKWIDERHGGVEAMLLNAGVSADHIALIRNNLNESL